jgi:hypothetical protein
VPHVSRAIYRREANRPFVSLELWTTIASVGTFVVITATAIAAVVQLIHIRSSNQIAILTDFRKETEDPEFRAAVDFIESINAKLEDPAFRALFARDPLPASLWGYLRVARLYENLGGFVKRGMLDADLVCDLWGPVVLMAWERTARATVVARRARGQAMLENFEYLALVAQRYLASHVTAYPKNAPHIAPEDPWAEEDGLM